MPGARISQAHGTVRPVDPATGAAGALVYALYHPAAALRSAEVERTSYADVAGIPGALLDARRRRETASPAAAQPVAERASAEPTAVAAGVTAAAAGVTAAAAVAAPAAAPGLAGVAVSDDQLTLF